MILDGRRNSYGVKDQLKSYRNKGGVTYVSYGDFYGQEIESGESNPDTASKEAVDFLKSQGFKSFRERIRGASEWRVFVEEKYEQER